MTSVPPPRSATGSAAYGRCGFSRSATAGFPGAAPRAVGAVRFPAVPDPFRRSPRARPGRAG